jgi:hypothetical protein
MFPRASIVRVDHFARASLSGRSTWGSDGGVGETLDVELGEDEKLRRLHLETSTPARTFACFQREPCHEPARVTAASAELLYDKRGRVRGIKRSGGVDVTIRYGANGLVESIIEPESTTRVRPIGNWIEWTSETPTDKRTHVAIFDADASTPRSVSELVWHGDVSAPVDICQLDVDRTGRPLRQATSAVAFMDSRAMTTWTWDAQQRLAGQTTTSPAAAAKRLALGYEANRMTRVTVDGVDVQTLRYDGDCRGMPSNFVGSYGASRAPHDICVYVISNIQLCTAPAGIASPTAWRLRISTTGDAPAIEIPVR